MTNREPYSSNHAFAPMFSRVLPRAMFPAIAALLFLTSCVAPGDSESDAANTGLDALASAKSPAPTTVAPVIGAKGKSALPTGPDLSLSSIFDEAASTTKPTTLARVRVAEAAPPALTDTPNTTQPEVETEINTGLASNAAPAPAPAPVAPKSADERLLDATRELRAVLTERSNSGAPRFADKATLAALDALLAPDSLPTSTADASLSPAQRSVLAAFSGLLKGFAAGPAKDGDPSAAAEVFDQASAAISTVQNVRIAQAALCRRVMGFGQYDPFPTNTFLAGRPNRALVYVEVDRLSHRAARDRDSGAADLGWSSSDFDQMWAVEVSEELGLWHDADGSLQWRRPEQTVVEVSRKRRRDFYLVQTIDLPETLSVGNYKLKIVIKDKISGSTDEVTVPIQVLADASGATRPTAQVPAR